MRGTAKYGGIWWRGGIGTNEGSGEGEGVGCRVCLVAVTFSVLGSL